MTKRVVLQLLAAFSIAAPASRAGGAVADPIAAFLAGADSSRVAGGGDGLEAWLAVQADLVGAAVARLIETGTRAGDEGDAGAEAANLALADSLARRSEAVGGSPAARRLVAEAREWGPAQRALRRAAKALETEADRSRKEGRPDAAIDLLLRADSLYAQVPDSHARAVVWGSLGVAHWSRGDWEQVEAAYQRALALRREVEDRILEGRTLNGLGSVLFQQSRYAEALDFYHQAATLRRRTGDLAGLGTSLTYEANCYLQLRQLLRARQLYEEALPVLERVGQPISIVETLNGLANLYDQMGRPRDAAERYARARAMCDTTPDCSYGPLLRVNLGMTYRSQGRLQEALSTLESARALLGEEGEPALRLQLHREFGLAALALGDRDAARDHLVAAVRLAQAGGDQGQQCDGLVNLATLYLQIDAAPQGLQAARQARELAEGLGDAVRLRDALSVEGEAQMRTGAWPEAAESFRRARDADEQAGALAAVAYDEIGLGGALSRLGQRDNARDSLRRAVRLLAETGREDETWVALLGIADTFESERPDSAVWHYDRALDALERVRAAVGGDAWQTGYLFAHRGRAYEEIARYYACRHQEDPKGDWAQRAFATAERSKARGLVELLARAHAGPSGPEADAVLDSLYETDATTAQGRARRARLQRSLAELSSPTGARRGDQAPSAPMVATPADVRRELPSHGVLLQYAVGDSATLLWVIDRRELTLVELPPRVVLRRDVQLLRDAIARPGAGDEALRQAARALYRTLVAPVEARLAGAEVLFVVPDDALFELPFEALLRRDPVPGAAWSDQPFLGADLAVVYAPSSSAYLELAVRARRKLDFDLDLLAFGAPDNSSQPVWGGIAQPPLAPLPEARREVETIGALSRDERRIVRLGEASEAELKCLLRTRTPRLLHLAAHGLVDPVEPARSCVALTGGAGGEDGFLYSLEILALPLRGPLVVLSACESAGGRLERGEGVVGLTRALLAAGARGTVASLWPVADASTSRFMQEFYRTILRERVGAAEALRRTRRLLLASEEWSHPFYWAPFVLVGTQRTPW